VADTSPEAPPVPLDPIPGCPWAVACTAMTAHLLVVVQSSGQTNVCVMGDELVTVLWATAPVGVHRQAAAPSRPVANPVRAARDEVAGSWLSRFATPSEGGSTSPFATGDALARSVLAFRPVTAAALAIGAAPRLRPISIGRLRLFSFQNQRQCIN
jgi:hypothetical protein